MAPERRLRPNPLDIRIRTMISKIKICTACLGLSSALGVLNYAAGRALADPQPTPQIEFTYYEHDFGTVDAGLLLDYAFVFKNVGQAPLVIREVKSTCECNTDPLVKNTYYPGESGRLQVYLRTGLRTRAISQRLNIFTNDPQGPCTVLKLIADVVSPVDISHNEIRLSVTSDQKVKEQVIELTSRDGIPFEITGAFTTAREIEVLAVLHRAQATHSVTVKASLGAGRNDLEDDLRLTLSHPKLSVVSIPIHVEASTSLSFSPQILFLGKLALGMQDQYTTEVTFKSDQASLEWKLDWDPKNTEHSQSFEVRLRPDEKNPRVWIATIRLKPGDFTPGFYQLTLAFKTDISDTPQVLIPVNLEVGTGDAATK